VLAQLDEWLIGPGEAGWVVVTGGPGMGKSAVLSAWLARREAAGASVAAREADRQDPPEKRTEAAIARLVEGGRFVLQPGPRPNGDVVYPAHMVPTSGVDRPGKHRGAGGAGAWSRARPRSGAGGSVVQARSRRGLAGLGRGWRSARGGLAISTRVRSLLWLRSTSCEILVVWAGRSSPHP